MYLMIRYDYSENFVISQCTPDVWCHGRIMTSDQTSQVSRFCRETHDFQLNLTVRHENLTIFGKPHVFQRKPTVFLYAQKF